MQNEMFVFIDRLFKNLRFVFSFGFLDVFHGFGDDLLIGFAFDGRKFGQIRVLNDRFGGVDLAAVVIVKIVFDERTSAEQVQYTWLVLWSSSL